MLEVVVGLGGNVDDPRRAFVDARDGLQRQAGDVASSALYRSRPMGPEQEDFLNAAVRLRWEGSLRALLELCHGLEAAAGRDRAAEARWGPRPLDLDLLIADGVVCRGRRLELPHPRLAERAFALVPAADVAAHWVHPIRARTLRQLADEAQIADPEAIRPVDERW